MLALIFAGCATAKIGPITGKKYSGFSVWMKNNDPEGAAYWREVRMTEYQKTHPKIDKNLYQTMLDGQIWVGMTAEQVQVSWGPPVNIQNQISSFFGKSEIWVYYGTWVWMNNGKVDMIQRV